MKFMKMGVEIKDKDKVIMGTLTFMLVFPMILTQLTVYMM